MASEKAKVGNFRNVRNDIYDIDFIDFKNPWNFYGLFIKSEPKELLKWFMDRGLIRKDVLCDICGLKCNLSKRDRLTDGFTWRCPKHRNFETGLRKYSFFEGSNFTLHDIMQIIYSFLGHETMLQMSKDVGMNYKKTAGTWMSKIRILFRKYVMDHIFSEKFEGEIEIDESKFGRKRKYHRGHGSGIDIWIFGMVEKKSNRIILYPVAKRDRVTLLPLIKRHVAEGARIYSDGWRAYSTLSDEGYDHYVVEHKHRFKQIYKNPTNGVLVRKISLHI